MKVCPHCGNKFGPGKKWPGNFRTQVFCSKECDTARKRYTPEQVAAAFWKRVTKTASCWLWTASKRWDGYGRWNPSGRQMTAHRYSWELANGPIPTGLEVCHTCNNPPCVNPAHLFLGTHLDNMRDAVNKGRQACGERVKRNKLTAAQVVTIRKLFKRINYRRSNTLELAKRYGVTPNAIRGIVIGESWKHLL